MRGSIPNYVTLVKCRSPICRNDNLNHGKLQGYEVKCINVKASGHKELQMLIYNKKSAGVTEQVRQHLWRT